MFSKKTNPIKPFLVNENPNYRFTELPKIPETQLVMVVPRRAWLRLPEYIQAFEAVHLAGRFGADPGDYEWEWVPNPEGLRWWRRTFNGSESLFGLALATQRSENVELYGLVEVDENSPFWSEVIPEEAANAMPPQAKLIAREHGRREEEVLAELYKEYFKQKGMLTLMRSGQPFCRRGTIREVERFRDAIKHLLERASRATLPSEMR
ncbi:MAG: hypothetical protein ACRDH2_07355 [Anaerolineales bacterium]